MIRWLIQNTSGKAPSGVSTCSKAMDILKERYARGEINLHEFESMKKKFTSMMCKGFIDEKSKYGNRDCKRKQQKAFSQAGRL
jgi:hypothetical protein